MVLSGQHALIRATRLQLCVWALALTACSTVGQPPRRAVPDLEGEAAPIDARTSSPEDLQATVSRLNAADPDAPATLIARLAYAESLLEGGTAADCQPRLAQAQSQLSAISKSPATAILFPRGWARAGDVQYRIHRFTAVCSQDAQERGRELLATLDAARRAVELYGGARDYQGMAAMQVNVARAQEQLGDQPAAREALEAAIAMDREFGFRNEAQDNYKYLAHLQNASADAAQLAARMSDFPSRSVTLTFAWSATDAAVALQSDRARLVDGQIFKSEARSELRSSVRASSGQWTLSEQTLSASDDAGVWSLGPVAPGVQDAVFTPALLQFPDRRISAAGDFERIEHVQDFADRLSSQVQAAIRSHARQDRQTDSLLEVGLQAARTALAPEVIEAQVTQSYSLETAMWIGATLQQGVWYETDASLMLPAMPSVVLSHRLQFTYTHPVSCTGDSDDRSCVELVVHATPDANALRELLDDLPRLIQYTTASDVRLVIDPHTLRPYADEIHRYWYAAIDKTPRLEAEHRSWSATYRP